MTASQTSTREPIGSNLPTKSTPSFTPREYRQLSTEETLASLPPASEEDILLKIRNQITSSATPTPLLIALDDDPTGTQTCHDIAVLTVWDHETLCKELSTAVGGFFILTSKFQITRFPNLCDRVLLPPNFLNRDLRTSNKY